MNKARGNSYRFLKPFNLFRTLLALVFFTSQGALAYQPENQFWKARSEARQKSLKPLLASVPMTPLSSPSLSPRYPTPNGALKLKEAPKSLAQILDQVPARLGHIKPVAPAKGASKGTILLLQDVHAHEEAQRHIAEMIRWVALRSDNWVLGLEGASGPLPRTDLKNFPFPNELRQTAERLLDENKISGAVLGYLRAGQQAPALMGVEDPGLYDQNVDALRSARENVRGAQAFLSSEEKILRAQMSSTFSNDLQELNALFNQAAEADESLVSVSDAIRTWVRRASAEGQFPTFVLFSETLELERALNFERIENDRKEFFTQLAAALSPKESKDLLNLIASHRLGTLSLNEFQKKVHRLAREKEIRLAAFPDYQAYVTYVRQIDQVDGSLLYEEMTAMESFLFSRFSHTPEQKELAHQLILLRLKRKLIQFGLTSAEWTRLREENLSTVFAPFVQFYQAAEKRDQVLAQRFLSQLENKSNGVLVLGGFHSKAVARQLAQAGFHVFEGTPRLLNPGAENEGKYFSAFEQNQLPLNVLFQGQKIFLASPPLSAGAEVELSLRTAPVIAKNNDNGLPPSLKDWFRLNFGWPNASIQFFNRFKGLIQSGKGGAVEFQQQGNDVQLTHVRRNYAFNGMNAPFASQIIGLLSLLWIEPFGVTVHPLVGFGLLLAFTLAKFVPIEIGAGKGRTVPLIPLSIGVLALATLPAVTLIFSVQALIARLALFFTVGFHEAGHKVGEESFDWNAPLRSFLEPFNIQNWLGALLSGTELRQPGIWNETENPDEVRRLVLGGWLGYLPPLALGLSLMGLGTGSVFSPLAAEAFSLTGATFLLAVGLVFGVNLPNQENRAFFTRQAPPSFFYGLQTTEPDNVKETDIAQMIQFLSEATRADSQGVIANLKKRLKNPKDLTPEDFEQALNLKQGEVFDEVVQAALEDDRESVKEILKNRLIAIIDSDRSTKDEKKRAAWILAHRKISPEATEFVNGYLGRTHFPHFSLRGNIKGSSYFIQVEEEGTSVRFHLVSPKNSFWGTLLGLTSSLLRNGQSSPLLKNFYDFIPKKYHGHYLLQLNSRWSSNKTPYQNLTDWLSKGTLLVEAKGFDDTPRKAFYEMGQIIISRFPPAYFEEANLNLDQALVDFFKEFPLTDKNPLVKLKLEEEKSGVLEARRPFNAPQIVELLLWPFNVVEELGHFFGLFLSTGLRLGETNRLIDWNKTDLLGTKVDPVTGAKTGPTFALETFASPRNEFFTGLVSPLIWTAVVFVFLNGLLIPDFLNVASTLLFSDHLFISIASWYAGAGGAFLLTAHVFEGVFDLLNRTTQSDPAKALHALFLWLEIPSPFSTSNRTSATPFNSPTSSFLQRLMEGFHKLTHALDERKERDQRLTDIQKILESDSLPAHPEWLSSYEEETFKTRAYYRLVRDIHNHSRYWTMRDLFLSPDTIFIGRDFTDETGTPISLEDLKSFLTEEGLQAYEARFSDDGSKRFPGLLTRSGAEGYALTLGAVRRDPEGILAFQNFLIQKGKKPASQLAYTLLTENGNFSGLKILDSDALPWGEGDDAKVRGSQLGLMEQLEPTLQTAYRTRLERLALQELARFKLVQEAAEDLDLDRGDMDYVDWIIRSLQLNRTGDAAKERYRRESEKDKLSRDRIRALLEKFSRSPQQFNAPTFGRLLSFLNQSEINQITTPAFSKQEPLRSGTFRIFDMVLKGPTPPRPSPWAGRVGILNPAEETQSGENQFGLDASETVSNQGGRPSEVTVRIILAVPRNEQDSAKRRSQEKRAEALSHDGLELAQKAFDQNNPHAWNAKQLEPFLLLLRPVLSPVSNPLLAFEVKSAVLGTSASNVNSLKTLEQAAVAPMSRLQVSQNSQSDAAADISSGQQDLLRLNAANPSLSPIGRTSVNSFPRDSAINDGDGQDLPLASLPNEPLEFSHNATPFPVHGVNIDGLSLSSLDLLNQSAAQSSDPFPFKGVAAPDDGNQSTRLQSITAFLSVLRLIETLSTRPGAVFLPELATRSPLFSQTPLILQLLIDPKTIAVLIAGNETSSLAFSPSNALSIFPAPLILRADFLSFVATNGALNLSLKGLGPRSQPVITDPPFSAVSPSLPDFSDPLTSAAASGLHSLLINGPYSIQATGPSPADRIEDIQKGTLNDQIRFFLIGQTLRAFRESVQKRQGYKEGSEQDRQEPLQAIPSLDDILSALESVSGFVGEALQRERRLLDEPASFKPSAQLQILERVLREQGLLPPLGSDPSLDPLSENPPSQEREKEKSSALPATSKDGEAAPLSDQANLRTTIPSSSLTPGEPLGALSREAFPLSSEGDASIDDRTQNGLQTFGRVKNLLRSNPFKQNNQTAFLSALGDQTRLLRQAQEPSGQTGQQTSSLSGEVGGPSGNVVSKIKSFLNLDSNAREQSLAAAGTAAVTQAVQSPSWRTYATLKDFSQSAFKFIVVFLPQLTVAFVTDLLNFFQVSSTKEESAPRSSAGSSQSNARALAQLVIKAGQEALSLEREDDQVSTSLIIDFLPRARTLTSRNLDDLAELFVLSPKEWKTLQNEIQKQISNNPTLTFEEAYALSAWIAFLGGPIVQVEQSIGDKNPVIPLKSQNLKEAMMEIRQIQNLAQRLDSGQTLFLVGAENQFKLFGKTLDELGASIQRISSVSAESPIIRSEDGIVLRADRLASTLYQHFNEKPEAHLANLTVIIPQGVSVKGSTSKDPLIHGALSTLHYVLQDLVFGLPIRLEQLQRIQELAEVLATQA